MNSSPSTSQSTENGTFGTIPPIGSLMLPLWSVMASM
jgi:hypothetical protein